MSSGGSDSSPGSTDSTPSSAEKDRSVVLSELLGHIHGYYKVALDRLPVDEMPVLIPRLLDAGVCFGLLDPVSNIIVSSIHTPSCEALSESNAAAQGKEEKMKAAAAEGEGCAARGRSGSKRKRTAMEEEQRRKDEVMSEITTDASSIIHLPPRTKSLSQRRTIAQRSLEGLATFLICYFRHLPVSEALHYLALSKADLLAAVHLIEHSRGVGCRWFPISSPTMETALRCAAMSASLPKPALFAARSLLLASRLDLGLSKILTLERGLSADAVNRFRELLDEPLKEPPASPEALRQATLRLNRYIKGTDTTFPLEFKETLRTLLLQKIHLLYLKAIALLPRDALRIRHHQGLLKAGYCFGPANDPVSNIILNTIWYDTVFPPSKEFKVDMISTRSLVRVECRSLNGLLAFLRALFPALSEHDAILYLLHSNANLKEAIFRAMRNLDMSSSYVDAYKAAAEAAWHPQPDALVEFAVSTRPSLLPIVKASQAVCRTLTSSEVDLIAAYFSEKPCLGKSVPSVPQLVPGAAKIVESHQQKFVANQYFIRRKVKAALKSYAKEKGIEYELHVICGANFDVPENGRHGYFWNRNGFPYTHVNFLARPKGSQADSTAPNLFFLECSIVEEDRDSLFSCHLELESPTDSGRCFHCECKGNKIVHPSFGTYRGRETDFEEMACGKRGIDNDGLLISEKMEIEIVGLSSEDDCVYFDPSMDYDFALGLNNSVREEEEAREELFGDTETDVPDMSCEPEQSSETAEDLLQD